MRTDITRCVAAVLLVASAAACSTATTSSEATTPPPNDAVASADPVAVRTVPTGGHGAAQIAPFALPTLEAFLADPVVDNVVIGTVVSKQVKVPDVDGAQDVFTLSDVEVETSHKPNVTTVVLGTAGGKVQLPQVHGAPRVGDRVLVALTADGGTLLHMVDEGGSFVWPDGADPVNPNWVKALSRQGARKLIAQL